MSIFTILFIFVRITEECKVCQRSESDSCAAFKMCLYPCAAFKGCLSPCVYLRPCVAFKMRLYSCVAFKVHPYRVLLLKCTYIPVAFTVYLYPCVAFKAFKVHMCILVLILKCTHSSKKKSGEISLTND